MPTTDLEQQVAALTAQVTTLSAQMEELVHAKAMADLVHAQPKLREHHCTRDEFQLAAYLSEVTYFTKPPEQPAQPGLDAPAFAALRALGTKQEMRVHVEEAIAEHPFVDPPAATKAKWYVPAAERIASGIEANPSLVMLRHEESSRLDGQVSLWRCDARKLVIVAWRGTDSAKDVLVDLKVMACSNVHPTHAYTCASG